MNEQEMNEVISRWVGECRHDISFKDEKYPNGVVCGKRAFCVKCGCDWEPRNYPQNIDYTSDPAAWIDLFALIEERGLALPFVKELKTLVSKDWYEWGPSLAWHMLQATPLQKAMALSKAIEEAA
jgi:hypothetical protein